MERRITIDIGDGTTPKASTLEQAEKLGKALAKFQAQEDKMMRLAQQLVPPSNSYRLDTEAIQRTIAEFQPDPIFPEDFFEKNQEYQQQSLDELRAINENTAQLKVIVELIHQSNEKQDELIALTGDILAIAKAKNKAEADSLLKKALEKISGTVDAGESILTMTKWALAIYKLVQPFL